MENTEVGKNNKKNNRLRNILSFFGVIAILALTTAIFIINQNEGKLDSKYETLNSKCQHLSDSMKTVMIMVKDTVYPALAEQQSYVKNFKDSVAAYRSYVNRSLVNQKNEVLSYVNSRFKKANDNLEAFGSSQIILSSAFNNDLKNVKSSLDILDVKVKTSVPTIFVLPIDSSKKTLAIDNDKKKISPKKNGRNKGLGSPYRTHFCEAQY